MEKVVYIAGRITGNVGYAEQFAQVEAELRAAGFVPLSPAKLPPEIDNARAFPICHAMIDAADAVLFIDGWMQSVGAQLELSYCKYIRKPYATKISALEVLK